MAMKRSYAESDSYIRFALAKASIYEDMPRMYRIFDFVDLQPTKRISTMGVAPQFMSKGKYSGRHTFYWNPEFATTITDRQLKGVILHELLHILLKHTTLRSPVFKSVKIDPKTGERTVNQEDKEIHDLWNISIDCALNPLIRNFLVDPDGPETGCFPENPAINLPPNGNAESYFNELKKRRQARQDFVKKLQDALKDLGLDSHDNWSPSGNEKHPASLSEAEKVLADKVDHSAEKELDQIAQDVGISQPGKSAATTGTINLTAKKEKKTPGWMKQTKHASVHGYSTIPQLTRKVPNRRFGVLFPGKRRLQIDNKVLVAVDISGSINRPLYEKFTEHLLNMRRFADYDMLFFNTRLTDGQGNYTKPENGSTILRKFKKDMQIRISGGTDFEPVIQFWNKARGKYDALFVFTDGCANYSTPPARSKEVNWIVYNSRSVDCNMPDGNKHYMNANE